MSYIPLVEDGMSKQELLEKHNHVLGLNNINLERGLATLDSGLRAYGPERPWGMSVGPKPKPYSRHTPVSGHG